MSQKAKFEGLNAYQKKWAHEQVKRFTEMGVAIPLGMIKEEAKKQECPHTKQYYCLVTGGGRCRACHKPL